MDQTLASVVALTTLLTGAFALFAVLKINELTQSPPMQVTKSRQVTPAKIKSTISIKSTKLIQPVKVAKMTSTVQQTKQFQKNVQLEMLFRLRMLSPSHLGTYLSSVLSLHRKEKKVVWVGSDEIVSIGEGLEKLEAQDSAVFFHPFVFMSFVLDGDYSNAYDADELEANKDVAMHVASLVEKHYYMMFLDAQHKEIVAMDSLYKRSDDEIKQRIDQNFFPVIQPFAKLKFTLRNLTGVECLQKGPTCGPWSIWLITAMVMNFGNCRGKDGIDVAPLDACSTEDVTKFYQNARL